MTNLQNQAIHPMTGNEINNNITWLDDEEVANASKYMNSDIIFDSIVDSNDNIIVIGFTGNNSIKYDGFVSKISPQGNIIWTYHFENTQYLQGYIGYAINIDSHDNIIVGFDAYGVGLPVIGDTSISKLFSSEPSGSIPNVYLAKLSPVGEIIWSTYFGGNQSDTIGKISIDSKDNILLSGNTNSPDLPLLIVE